MPSRILTMLKSHEVKWTDLRLTDTRGKEQPVTIPAAAVDESLFEEGKRFDFSSVAGWKDIHESDMVLMPARDSAVLDPFTNDPHPQTSLQRP